MQETDRVPMLRAVFKFCWLHGPTSSYLRRTYPLSRIRSSNVNLCRFSYFVYFFRISSILAADVSRVVFTSAPFLISSMAAFTTSDHSLYPGVFGLDTE